MFKCLKCGEGTTLPVCERCGFVFEKNSNIFNLTNDPNIQIKEGNIDKYIGYDNIGEFYSGKYWYKISNRDYAIGKKLSSIINNGTLLDLACGDGFITLPTAKHGAKIIAADISKKMLSLLIQKAEYNSINLDNVNICRMNALNIQLEDNSVEFTIANGVLHLISNPQKVISELYRVLKADGKLISLNDTPGRKSFNNVEENKKYFALVNEFYNRYWELLEIEQIQPRKYSWKFDKTSEFNKLFKDKIVIELNFSESKTISLEDGFLYRLGGRGFSDQVAVPEKQHYIAYKKVIDELSKKHGRDFIKIEHHGVEESIQVEIYEKK